MLTPENTIMNPVHGNQHISRRRFLQGLTYGTLALATMPKLAQAAFADYGHKTLALEHHHTGETLDITYYSQGRYIYGALDEISYLLRDYHTDEVRPIDPALLDQLHDVKLLLGSSYRPFHVVSGYRSPETNANLRRHKRGVARQSLHMEGKAIDIRIEGVSARSIRDAALSLQRGGVGFYPSENFVHLDTGGIRTWRR